MNDITITQIMFLSKFWKYSVGCASISGLVNMNDKISSKIIIIMFFRNTPNPLEALLTIAFTESLKSLKMFAIVKIKSSFYFIKNLLI